MRTFLFIALASVCAPAFAQGAPPPGNIDERVRQQFQQLSDRDRADALMTGDTDILLLQRTRLFSLTASSELSYTSNAALAPTGETADGYTQAQLGLTAGTRIGGKVDVFAGMSISGVRYFDQAALDYGALAGIVGARASLGRIELTATYQPTMVFDRSFSTRQLTTHRFRLTAALRVPVGRLTIDPEIHGERAIAHPTDYSEWSGGGSVTVSAPLSAKVPLSAYAQIGYDRRSFDDYFSAFVGTDRRDDLLSASAGIVWQPRTWGQIRASYSFGRNWSTSDVNPYTVHSGTIGLTGTLRF